MIYQLAQDIGAGLVARRYPVRVEYGATPTDGSGIAGRSYVLEFSRDPAGDAVRAPQARQSGVLGTTVGSLRAVRDVGVAVRVFVRSAKAGARLNEHEHDCDDLVDALTVELIKWTTAAKCGAAPAWREARYLAPAELGLIDAAGHAAGVVYLLRFTIPRGVVERNYAGEAAPTGEFASAVQAVRATLDGETYQDVPLGGDEE